MSPAEIAEVVNYIMPLYEAWTLLGIFLLALTIALMFNMVSIHYKQNQYLQRIRSVEESHLALYRRFHEDVADFYEVIRSLAISLEALNQHQQPPTNPTNTPPPNP